MLSWKLWRLINDAAPNTYLHRVLLAKPLQTEKDTASALLYALGMMMYLYIPYIMLPLTVHYFGLQLAQKLAFIAAKQHEGQYDLIAITPMIGDYGFIMEICRLIFQDVVVRANHFFDSIAIAVAIGIFIFMCATSDQFLWRLLTVVLLGGFLFLEYKQSLVVGALIGGLAASFHEQNQAQSIATGSYIGAQVGFYIVLLVFWFYLSVILGGDYAVVSTLSIVSAFMSCCLLREVAIFGLWRWLRIRLNDDVPAFNRKTQ